jgi:hypothetical protein
MKRKFENSPMLARKWPRFENAQSNSQAGRPSHANAVMAGLDSAISTRTLPANHALVEPGSPGQVQWALR